MGLVVDAKTKVWYEFRQTIQPLRKGKQCLAQAVFNSGGELQSLTEDIVGQWKEHFEELFNLINMSSSKEAESEDVGQGAPQQQSARCE